MQPRQATFDIQRLDGTAPAELFGMIIPDEWSGRRIRLNQPTTPPEHGLLLATVILLVIYDC